MRRPDPHPTASSQRERQARRDARHQAHRSSSDWPHPGAEKRAHHESRQQVGPRGTDHGMLQRWA